MTIFPLMDLFCASVSYGLYDIDNKIYLSASEIDQCLIPASLQKIVITAVSKEILGEDYCFKTSVTLKGTVKNKLLYGSLVIRGSGDPLFSDQDLLPLVRYLSNRKIAFFRGKIIIDSGIYDEEHYPDAWNGRDWYPGVYSRIGGFNINHNMYRVKKAKSSGYQIIPEPGKNDREYIRKITGEVGGEELFIRAGDLRSYLSASIKHLFQSQGIQLSEEEIANPGGTLLQFNAESPRLAEILKTMNSESDNLTAESLLKLLGHLETGGKGSSADGLRVMNEKLKDILPEGIIFADGSGFSTKNRLSTRFLISLLLRSDYSSLLADCQEKLSSVINIEIPRGFVIYYKTGSIRGVRALAGYITYRGSKYAFSVIINDETGNLSKFKNLGKYLNEFFIRIEENGKK